jgi:hypothetical protein
MCSVPTKPGFAREDLLLTMDLLYANESIPRAPYTGTSLVESHAPDRGVEKPTTEKQTAENPPA